MHYQIENVSYDSIKGIIHKNGNDIDLTKLQSKLLNFYIDHPKIIHTKTTIMKSVWGRIITNNSVDQINSILRNHIEKDPSQPKAIVSHFGKGVSFEGKIIKTNSKLAKKTSNKKNVLYLLLFLGTIIGSWQVLTTYRKSSEPVITAQSKPIPMTQANRLMFLPSINNKEDSDNQNSATQMLISELLRFSSDNDIVDTSRYPNADKKQQFAKKLWHLNPSLNLVKTQLSEQDKTYSLVVEMINGKQFDVKKEFSGVSIHDVVLNAVSWISQQNSQQNLDNDLLNLLPNNKYLVETYMRGFSFLNSGEQGKSIEYFKLCLQEKPNFHLARFSLAHALRRFSQYDESIAQLKTLKSVNLGNNLGIAVDSEFAAVELIRGHLDKAKTKFEQIIHDYPMSFRLYPAYMNLAATEYRMGNYEQALNLLSKLEKIMDEKTHPDDAAIVAFTTSGVYLYQKQLDQSFKYLNKSLRLFKQANDIQRVGMTLSRISNYYKMIGDLHKAEDYIQQSFDIANQLGNKRSQLAALNHMVEFKIIQGKFDQASELNESLSNLATEMNSLAGKISVAQWNVELSIENKNYPQAQQFLEKHQLMAQERDSKPSLNSNLILQLALALELNDDTKAELLIQQLQQLPDNDSLQTNFINLYANYLSKNKPSQDVIGYLENKIKLAQQQSDHSLAQHLTILLAKEHLKTNPKTSVQILKAITVDDLNQYPYYSLYAKALFATENSLEALLQMENAKQTYHQRWDQTLQVLYLKIKLSVKT